MSAVLDHEGFAAKPLDVRQCLDQHLGASEQIVQSSISTPNSTAQRMLACPCSCKKTPIGPRAFPTARSAIRRSRRRGTRQPGIIPDQWPMRRDSRYTAAANNADGAQVLRLIRITRARSQANLKDIAR